MRMTKAWRSWAAFGVSIVLMALSDGGRIVEFPPWHLTEEQADVWGNSGFIWLVAALLLVLARQRKNRSMRRLLESELS